MAAPTGFTRELREWFESHPAEDLTQEQMVEKFGASLVTVRNACWTLGKQGYLKREAVYRLDKGAD